MDKQIIKKVCGYEDSKGKFHNTKAEVRKAEKCYRMKYVSKKLHNLDARIENYFQDYEYSNTNYERKENFIKMISKNILRDSNAFIEIINLKKEYEKELEELSKKENIFNIKKWFQIKWW